MSKEFNKNLMHPTRRKLAEMVLTGEYEKDIKVSFGNTKESINRNVGDIWEDESGNLWEQKDGYRVKKSKLTDTMSEIRDYISDLDKCTASDCSKIKYGYTDKKLIKKTGFCSSCLAKRELQIKIDGMWDDYSSYRIYSNMISYGEDIIEKLKETYENTKQEYEYVNDTGEREIWKMDKDVNELKADIQQDIEKFEIELSEVKEKQIALYEKLKPYNYELVKTH